MQVALQPYQRGCPTAGRSFRCAILIGRFVAVTMPQIFLATLALALVGVVPIGRAAQPPTRDLKALAFGKQPAQAKALFEASRDPGQPLDAKWLEAMSWVGRAGAIGRDWELAADYSERTLAGCESLLRNEKLESDPQASLPIALGAAIETLGKVHVAAGDRAQAAFFLREQLKKYSGSSIETRLTKNLLLLDLAGKPMPAINSGERLGERRFDPGTLRDKVALFFFWAHWCSDCRTQKPVLSRLQRQFGARGLRIVAPTRLYGYVERGREADASNERAYIETAHVSKDALLRSVPVPLSGENFVSFGVSTTPTLVLVDRSGVVRLYHPGAMEEADLARRIEALL